MWASCTTSEGHLGRLQYRALLQGQGWVSCGRGVLQYKWGPMFAVPGCRDGASCRGESCTTSEGHIGSCSTELLQGWGMSCGEGALEVHCKWVCSAGRPLHCVLGALLPMPLVASCAHAMPTLMLVCFAHLSTHVGTTPTQMRWPPTAPTRWRHERQALLRASLGPDLLRSGCRGAAAAAAALPPALIGGHSVTPQRQQSSGASREVELRA